MIAEIAHQTSYSTAAAAYTRALLDRAAALRLPELFVSPHPDGLYHLPNRHGVCVTALRTSSLSHEQLTDILTYRLAQYLITNFFDPYLIYEGRMTHEPFSTVSSNDIHVLAGSPETGQIFCYLVLRSIDAAPSQASLHAHNRLLFPVEQAFGRGIYNDLNILPDLPLAQVVELSRFAKNHQLDAADSGSVRGPVEIGVALYHILCDSLNQQITAVVGEVEERVAKRNLDFFHIPTVFLREAVPCGVPAAYVSDAYRSREFYPFAFLVSDFARQTSRVAAIERALEQPGDQGIRAVLALKRDKQIPRSSLQPDDGQSQAIAPEVRHYLPLAHSMETASTPQW